MARILIALNLVVPILVFAEWEPPKNPNPRTILEEARADAKAGRFESALAKYVWFHRHALEVDRAYFGVRLSGALLSWHQLAQSYPPAMEKLKATRDDAAERVIRKGDHKSDDVWDSFADMAAINELLDSDGQTVQVFVKLDRDSPTVAKEVYRAAQPALIEAKRFDLCGKYILPRDSYDEIVSFYQFNLDTVKEYKSERRRSAQRDYADRVFINGNSLAVCSTLRW